ncbi:MAG: DUF4062 domain-containing protein [Chthonomonas sp.]|nr:DUF4062 domain-containing protein [Chthonomonas sp.]
MISRKLQIFVSSTYTDMKDERQAAVEAILQAGHIPAGMELFAAGDESQLEIIKKWIDQSDALLILLGERYGSIEPKSGKAYVEVEYDHALESGKPVFGVCLSDPMINAKYQALGKSATDEHRPQHSAFKERVMSKQCGEANDIKDIKYEVLKTLNNYSQDEGLVGWVRADEYRQSIDLSRELQATIGELRTKASNASPSLKELHNEFDVFIADLKEIPFELEFKYKFSNEPAEHDYRLETTLLGMCFYFSSTLISEHGIPDDFPPGSKFKKDVAILRVWDLITPSYRPVVTPKGRLFFEYLRECGIAEESKAKFIQVSEPKEG